MNPSPYAKATAAGASTQVLHFLPPSRKVYVRPTSGRFSHWRWAMVAFTQLLFYGLCWLPWDGRQAVLFDLVQRKFYLFGLVLWPQDGIYLALLLIAAALTLFFVTTVAGRVFCGFACPQSVYTAIFLWIEQRIEGKPLARMQRDTGAWSVAKVRIKLAKHGAWLAVSLWTGLTFVGYFTPMRSLLPSTLSLSTGPWEGFWILFYAGFTYLQAGHLREMVCRHMCPYARFQGVMMDADSVTITYDKLRGEPRTTARARHADASGRTGDCVDCGICEQVCPAGIDIRHGAQYECINCGLCADGCDRVMLKLGRAPGLIRMASEHELASAAHVGATPRGLGAWSWPRFMERLRRPRVLIYAALTVLMLSVIVAALATRVPLRADILRDRGVLAREVGEGSIENVYLLKLMNLREAPHRLRVRVVEPDGVVLAGSGLYDVPAGQILTVPMTLRLVRPDQTSGMRRVAVRIEDADTPAIRVDEETSFFVP